MVESFSERAGMVRLFEGYSHLARPLQPSKKICFAEKPVTVRFTWVLSELISVTADKWYVIDFVDLCRSKANKQS